MGLAFRSSRAAAGTVSSPARSSSGSRSGSATRHGSILHEPKDRLAGLVSADDSARYETAKIVRERLAAEDLGLRREGVPRQDGFGQLDRPPTRRAARGSVPGGPAD